MVLPLVDIAGKSSPGKTAGSCPECFPPVNNPFHRGMVDLLGNNFYYNISQTDCQFLL